MTNAITQFKSMAFAITSVHVLFLSAMLFLPFPNRVGEGGGDTHCEVGSSVNMTSIVGYIFEIAIYSPQRNKKYGIL